MIHIQPYTKDKLHAVLSLIERSDSTNRTENTWNENNMTAVIAYDENTPVGIIPFERRSIHLNENSVIDVLWVSAAHVDPGYRNKGIGSLLDISIREYFADTIQAVMVLRQDETSPAYRWYKKNGYVDLLPILAFKKNTETNAARADFCVIDAETDLINFEQGLYECFIKNTKNYFGYPVRNYQFWQKKIKYHYYKDNYTYSILSLIKKNIILGYALLGKTNMKDGIERFDILDISLPDDLTIQDSLLYAIMEYAARFNIKEIRIQLSYQDKNIDWIKSREFKNRWRTNILGKFIDPISYLKKKISGMKVFNGYTLIWETPQLGQSVITVGTNILHLFSEDQVLHRILFGRCDVERAIEYGDLVVVEGLMNIGKKLKILFPYKKWAYFQIDYI